MKGRGDGRGHLWRHKHTGKGRGDVYTVNGQSRDRWMFRDLFRTDGCSLPLRAVAEALGQKRCFGMKAG